MMQGVAAVSHSTTGVAAGAAAGALSTFLFTVAHHLWISNIWFSFPFMLIAGVLCGVCLSWSYGVLFARPSVGTWLAYNFLHIALLIALGIFSMLFFEPAISMTALMQMSGPPSALMAQALPLMVVFTLAASGALTLLLGRTLRAFAANLLAVALLFLLLGHNTAILGLVAVPRGALYLVLEFFGLIILLGAIFALAFIALIHLPIGRKS